MSASPPGYRRLEPHDLAVGKDVLYISRDPSTPQIRTKILDTTINKDTINLKHKCEAPMKRVFVEEKAAVGAEATGPNEAVVGADTDKFLRNEVVGWISSLEVVGSSLPEALDVALARLGKTPEDMVQPQPQPLAGPAGALWR